MWLHCIRTQDSPNGIQRGKKSQISSLKEQGPFWRRSDRFLLEPGSPQSMSLQQFVTGNSIFIFQKKLSYIFVHFCPEKSGSESGSSTDPILY